MIFHGTFVDKKTGKPFKVEIQFDQDGAAKLMAERALEAKAGVSISLKGNIRCRVIEKP